MSRVFSEELVNSVAKEMKVADLANATIGDVLLVASRLEELTGIPFIRMDQGSPGLPANKIGIEADPAAEVSLRRTGENAQGQLWLRHFPGGQRPLLRHQCGDRIRFLGGAAKGRRDPGAVPKPSAAGTVFPGCCSSCTGWHLL